MEKHRGLKISKNTATRGENPENREYRSCNEKKNQNTENREPKIPIHPPLLITTPSPSPPFTAPAILHLNHHSPIDRKPKNQKTQKKQNQKTRKLEKQKTEK